jgi:hypothetical protein
MHKIGRALRICVPARVIVVPAVAFAAPPGPKAVTRVTYPGANHDRAQEE